MSQYSANAAGDREWYADERPLPESQAREIYLQYRRYKKKATLKRLKSERQMSLMAQENDPDG